MLLILLISEINKRKEEKKKLQAPREIKARVNQTTQRLFSTRGFDFICLNHNDLPKFFPKKIEQKPSDCHHQLLVKNCFKPQTINSICLLGPLCLNSFLTTTTVRHLLYHRHCTQHFAFIISFNIYNPHGITNIITPILQMRLRDIKLVILKCICRDIPNAFPKCKAGKMAVEI